MLVATDPPLHLTYCTNIHAAAGWDGVFANLQRHAPALKRRWSPDAPFGLGLRLSARDAAELLDGHLDRFAEWLQAEGLYVAIINGFPHGSFHRSVVKADVYAPDWRDAERLRYTRDLVRILARLLPAGVEGGVSTAPLSYKAWMTHAGDADWRAIVDHLAALAIDLVRLRDTTGAFVHLDIEPEPDCVLETSDETVAFFEERLLPGAAPIVARACGMTDAEARDRILDHVRVCFDCCHFAVEYEDPHEALARLARAGLKIGRVQLSAALDVRVPADAADRARTLDRLREFADATYLHQAVERHAGALTHFPDLPPAIDAAASGPARDLRIHFHVPLFATAFDGLGSTQPYVRDVLAAARTSRFTQHLEIETYTWDVLPASLKLDIGESISREYEWTVSNLKFER